MAENSIRISLELADSAAQNALTNFIKRGADANSQFDKLKITGKSTFSDIALSISKTSGIFDIFAGNLAANLVGKALEVIKSSFGNLIEEAAGSEQAIKNLNVALNNAGQFTDKASSDLQKFAGSLQEVTIYSDEAILSSATLLLNLTSLSKDGVQSATRAATDLASTLNIDLNSATELITKAVNGNFTAFKKMGIEIKSADSDSGRLTNTLKALASQNGAAEATTSTYAGAVAKAKNQQSELFESIGKLITQSDVVVNGLETQSSLYTELANFITNNTQVIRDLGTAITITAGIVAASVVAYAAASFAIGVLAVAAATGATGFGVLGVAASSAWALITAPVTIVVAAIGTVVAIVYQLVKNWEAVKASTYEALAAALEFSAKTASLVSDKISFKLFDQAKAYRDQAKSIREVALATKEKTVQDATNDKLSDDQQEKNRKRQADAQKEAQLHSQYLVSIAKIQEQEIELSETEHNQKSLELLESYNEQKEISLGVYDTSRLEQIYIAGEVRLAAQQELDRRELELQIAKQIASAQSEKDDVKRKEELRKVNDKATLSRTQLLNKQELDSAKAKLDAQKAIDKLREDDQKSTYSTIATLSNSNNKTLAAIGKAAGITQIAIETPIAIAKALSAFPPPFNLVAAGFVGAAMAAQAAQIAGIQFADGGIVPGSSFSGDKVQARVNSSEMILNRTQQNELFKIAKGESPSGGNSISREDVFQIVNAISSRPVMVEIDGREIIAITRSQLASGRTLG